MKKTKARRRLENQFYYYKRKYIESLDQRVAFAKANERPLDTGNMLDLFKHMTIKDITEHGISRKGRGGYTKYYYGNDALRKQIESLKKASDPFVRRDIFVKNYLKSLREVGMKKEFRDKISMKMKNINPDRLAYITQRDILKQISYIYVKGKGMKKQKLSSRRIPSDTLNYTTEEEELFNSIMNALDGKLDDKKVPFEKVVKLGQELKPEIKAIRVLTGDYR